MNVSRFCSVQGAADDAATHQRIAEYVRPRLEKYPGRGFSPELEWVVEQTVEALIEQADNIKLSPRKKGEILSFLHHMSEEIPGER